MPYRFEPATRGDDAALRALLAGSPVPGRIAVTYEREPDFFLGERSLGPFVQTFVARDEASGALAGVASRAVRPSWVNGTREDVGYLSQLRVARGHEGRGLVTAGFRYLAELHRDGRAAGYLTTIVEENAVARRLLVEAPRPSVPGYREIARVETLALEVRPARAPALDVARAADDGLEAAVAFLNEAGGKRNLYPVVEASSLDGVAGPPAADLWVVRRGGAIAGAGALWDQSGFKQTVVRGYPAGLRRVHDMLQRLRGGPPLPAVGERVRYGTVSHLAVAGDDPSVLEALLNRLLGEASARGYAWLMLGLTSRDPLLPVARRRRHVRYRSRLYAVTFPGDPDLAARLDARLPHVEIGAL